MDTTVYPPAVSVQQNYRPMTIGDWIVTHLLLAIPVVGFVLMIVWALSSETQQSKKTYCQAGLIIIGCFVVLGVIAVIALGGLTAISAAASHSHPTPQP